MSHRDIAILVVAAVIVAGVMILLAVGGRPVRGVLDGGVTRDRTALSHASYRRARSDRGGERLMGLVVDLHARAAVREVDAGGSAAGSARPGLTASAGVDVCTCSPFLLGAAHALCPSHGLVALVRGFGEAA